MLAHRLRHRVTFQHLAPIERDENNVPIPGTGGWQTVVLADGTRLESVPAEVLTGPGREFQGGAATQSETSARINLRWFPAAERDMAAWRILWDGRIYNIQSVETDITARREWRLRVVDGPSEGAMKKQLDRIEAKLDALLEALAEEDEDQPQYDLDGNLNEGGERDENESLG